MRDLLLKASNWKLRSPWIAGQLTIWSCILIGAFLTSLFMHYSSISISATLSAITFTISGCAILIGGFVAGHKSGRRGWLYGGVQGIIYSFTLFIISYLAFDSSMRINLFIFSIFAFGISSIGGIIGVNIKK